VGRHKQAGFTIVELLIAIAVMGILVPTLAGLINTMNRLNDRARDLNIVNSLAENKAESLRSMGFSALSDGSTSFATELPVTLGSPKSATYTVSNPHTGIKQVDMTITYTDHNKTETMRYRTYVGELGVGQY
jgi:prepilin-type N-terminal cleavage/methylation domain-containing protein